MESGLGKEIGSLREIVNRMKYLSAHGKYLLFRLEWFAQVLGANWKSKRFPTDILFNLRKHLKELIEFATISCEKCKRGKVQRLLTSRTILRDVKIIHEELDRCKAESGKIYLSEKEPENLSQLKSLAKKEKKKEMQETDVGQAEGNNEDDPSVLLKWLLAEKKISYEEVDSFRKDLLQEVSNSKRMDDCKEEIYYLNIIAEVTLELHFMRIFVVPPEYTCPMTGDIMKEPVIVVDSGNTYDQSAIETWFANGKKTDPMTEMELASAEIIPNNTLKALIASYIESKNKMVLQFDFESMYKKIRTKNITIETRSRSFSILSEAAMRGVAQAKYFLARCYEYGFCTSVDTEMAGEYYYEAAEQGEIQAQWDLAICLLTGNLLRKDRKEAEIWLKKAIRQEIKDPIAALYSDPVSLIWQIECPSSLRRGLRSKVYNEHGIHWVLSFPFSANSESLVLTLSLATTYSEDWSVNVHFSVILVNQVDPENNIIGDGFGKFSTKATGWSQQIDRPASEIFNPDNGFLADDTLVVDVKVSVRAMGRGGGNKNA